MRSPAPFSHRARNLLAAASMAGAFGGFGVVIAAAGPSGAATGSSVAVQANLETAFTAAKTWYSQMNQSYDGLDPATFKEYLNGIRIRAVDGRTPSTSASVFSMHVTGLEGTAVILAASAGAGAICWAIVNITSSSVTLDGLATAGTLWVKWPDPPNGACEAIALNRKTRPAGMTWGLTGWPAG